MNFRNLLGYQFITLMRKRLTFARWQCTAELSCVTTDLDYLKIRERWYHSFQMCQNSFLFCFCCTGSAASLVAHKWNVPEENALLHQMVIPHIVRSCFVEPCRFPSFSLTLMTVPRWASSFVSVPWKSYSAIVIHRQMKAVGTEMGL